MEKTQRIEYSGGTGTAKDPICKLICGKEDNKAIFTVSLAYGKDDRISNSLKYVVVANFGEADMKANMMYVVLSVQKTDCIENYVHQLSAPNDPMVLELDNALYITGRFRQEGSDWVLFMSIMDKIIPKVSEFYMNETSLDANLKSELVRHLVVIKTKLRNAMPIVDNETRALLRDNA
jgi:hypothetical protein